MDRDHQDTTTATPLDETSHSYVGRWARLVSTTNWEKGRIIHEWRSELIAKNAPSTELSDEAWSRLVGGVTGQHAGRLRRVYERFGDVYTQYDGLFWSHFQSCLDWDDAEMWLEGAIQNKWSVAVMRRKRWETLGDVEAEKPRDDEIVTAEVDEDFAETGDAGSAADATPDILNDDFLAEARSPAGPDFGDEEDVATAQHAGGDASEASVKRETQEAVQPFAELPDLPEDVAAAFESFQLAILYHKQDQWRSVSCADILHSLDALKALAQAP